MKEGAFPVFEEVTSLLALGPLPVGGLAIWTARWADFWSQDTVNLFLPDTLEGSPLAPITIKKQINCLESSTGLDAKKSTYFDIRRILKATSA